MADCHSSCQADGCAASAAAASIELRSETATGSSASSMSVTLSGRAQRCIRRDPPIRMRIRRVLLGPNSLRGPFRES